MNKREKYLAPGDDWGFHGATANGHGRGLTGDGGPPRAPPNEGLGSDGGRRIPITHVDGRDSALVQRSYALPVPVSYYRSGFVRCHVMLRCRLQAVATTHQCKRSAVWHAAEVVRLDTRRPPRALEPAYVVRAVRRALRARTAVLVPCTPTAGYARYTFAKGIPIYDSGTKSGQTIVPRRPITH